MVCLIYATRSRSRSFSRCPTPHPLSYSNDCAPHSHRRGEVWGSLSQSSGERERESRERERDFAPAAGTKGPMSRSGRPWSSEVGHRSAGGCAEAPRFGSSFSARPPCGDPPAGDVRGSAGHVRPAICTAHGVRGTAHPKSKKKGFLWPLWLLRSPPPPHTQPPLPSPLPPTHPFFFFFRPVVDLREPHISCNSNIISWGIPTGRSRRE
jgi:hypothetical protein